VLSKKFLCIIHKGILQIINISWHFVVNNTAIEKYHLTFHFSIDIAFLEILLQIWEFFVEITFFL